MAPDLSIDKSAKRLCIYIGESDRWRGKPLYAAILETLKAEGVAGATVLRGVAGYGAHSRIHTAAILRLSEDLPLLIEVIDSPEKITKALESISPMVREGLITLEDVQVVRYTHRYLNPLPADKLVSEAMTREVITLTPDMTVAQAWQRMLKHLLKALPVVKSSGEVIGMLTDEDLFKRAGLQQRLAVAERLDGAMLEEELGKLNTSQLKVEDVMSQPAITAWAKEPLGVAAARMAQHGIKRLPVLDDNGKLAGVLSRVDVLCQVMSAEPKARKAEVSLRAARSVQEVMYSQIPSVRQDDDLAAIVSRLLDTSSHRLIVVDENEHPVGLISDADVVSRISPQERRGVLDALRSGGKALSSDVTAVELMSPGVLTALPETSLVEAAKMMLAAQRKWLVVVDSNGKVMGLVDRQILLRAMTGG